MKMARAHESESPPVGATSSWPPSLRTAIRLMSAAAQPTAIGWGPGLLEFHNDAFKALVGVGGGAPAGGPLHALCADLWPRLEPLVDAALRSGESAALEGALFCRNHHGYVEESYVTCACGPLLDDAGQIGGVVVTVADTTEQILSVRRTAALRDIAAAAATVRTVTEGCDQALAAVARHLHDIPFALLYLRELEGRQVRLTATAGLRRGTSASPESIELDVIANAPSWPAAAALRTNETIVVDDLLARFGSLPAGDWPFAPRCAVVVPVTSPGRDEPDGVLVTGVSARHNLDEQYGAFIELVVKQIAAAIAGGRVHEEEERQAAARVTRRMARAKRRARLRAMKARFAGILEERTRLAREIHDTVLQGVTGIALQLRAVHPHVRTSPDESADALQRIIELAEKTSREARQAVWDMRPAALADGNLARAVEVAAQRLAGDAAIGLEMSVTGETRPLPASRQSAAVRIVQEAVANVVRHAAAHTIHVRVSYGRRRLRVAVTDDGRGFAVQPDFRSYEGHWGLLGMQERANSVGGALLVRSVPERGTTVAFVLPYAATVRKTSHAS